MMEPTRETTISEREHLERFALEDKVAASEDHRRLQRAAILAAVHFEELVPRLLQFPARFFTDGPSRAVLESIKRLKRKGVPVNLALVGQDMNAAQQREPWSQMLTEMMAEDRAFVVGSGHFEGYLEEIASAAVRRELSLNLNTMQALLRQPDLNLDDIRGEITKRLSRCFDGLGSRHSAVHISEALRRLGDWMVERAADHAAGKTRSSVDAMPTGFRQLDEVIEGLAPGQLIGVSAPPGGGKSAFCTQLCINCSSWGKVHLSSLEMTELEVCRRITQQVKEMPWREVPPWRVFEMADLVKNGLYLDCESHNVDSLLRSWWAFKQEHPDTVLFAVDYAQLLAESDQKEQSRVSRMLKAFAMNERVPVLALLQPKSDVEQRKDYKPSPADLKETGQWRQDCSKILQLWAPHKVDPRSYPDPDEHLVCVTKNRDGQCLDVGFTWEGATTRFIERSGPPKPPCSDEQLKLDQAMTAAADALKDMF